MNGQSTQTLEPRGKRDRDTIVGWIFIGLVVLVLGLTGYGLYLLFSTAPPEVIAAVIVASGTIGVSILTYVFSRHLERRRTRQQKEHEQRAESYQYFMNFCLQVLTEDEDEQLNKKERMERFQKFSQKLIVWGSDAFLERYLVFKILIDLESYRAYKVEITEPRIAAALLEFEKLLYAIRADLNNDSKQRPEQLPQGALLKMFLRDGDVEEIMQSSQQDNAELPAAEGTPPKEGKSYEHV